MSTHRAPRAVLYLRLSVTTEASTSIDRQREDLLARAAREGWDVVRILEDDGLSGGKARANADEALGLLRSGAADVLAVWKFDRWSRQGLGAVARLVEVLDDRPEALFVADRDGLDSRQPAWRIIAAVLSEVARQERENTQTRTRSSIARLKRERRFSGGTVPLGYRTAPSSDGPGRVLVVAEEESRYLTEAAERIAAGESVYAVTAWLNASPLRPRKAASWSIQAVAQALTGTAVVGRVTSSGAVLRDDDGMPAQVWPPAIPLDVWHAVRATLEARAAARTPAGERRRGARSRLLSGLIVCGGCGSPLYVRTSGRGERHYRCSARSNGRPCTVSASISAERVEEHVEAAFLRAVGSWPVLRPREVEAPAAALVEAERALADVTARLDDLDLDDDDEARLLAQRHALRERVRSLRAEAASTPPAFELEETDRTMRDVWEAAADDVAARRSLLTDALDVVEVGPGVRGRTGLDPSRVVLRWRHTPERD